MATPQHYPSLLVFPPPGENPNWVLRAFISGDNKSLAQLGSQSPQGFYLLLVSFLRPKEQDTWGSTNGKSPLSYNSILLDLHSLIQGLVYRICGPHWHWQNSYNPVSFHSDLAVNSFLGATFSTPNLVLNLESKWSLDGLHRICKSLKLYEKCMNIFIGKGPRAFCTSKECVIQERLRSTALLTAYKQVAFFFT